MKPLIFLDHLFHFDSIKPPLQIFPFEITSEFLPQPHLKGANGQICLGETRFEDNLISSLGTQY